MCVKELEIYMTVKMQSVGLVIVDQFKNMESTIQSKKVQKRGEVTV